MITQCDVFDSLHNSRFLSAVNKTQVRDVRMQVPKQ
jgi:hypothetical protein